MVIFNTSCIVIAALNADLVRVLLKIIKNSYNNYLFSVNLCKSLYFPLIIFYVDLHGTTSSAFLCWLFFAN